MTRADPRRLVLAWTLTLALLAGLAVVFMSPRPPQECLPDLGANIAAEPVRISNPTAALSIRVASWNTLATNPSLQVIAGLRSIGGSADVIGLQELSSDARRAAVTTAMTGEGWGVSQGNNAVKIIWRASRYTALAQGSEKVFGIERVEAGTAGTSIGPKAIQWVQLKDRTTGAVAFVVNQHIVADIDRRGHPRPDAPRRLALYRQQIAALVSVVTKLRAYGPVMVTGDFNISAKADQQVKDPTFPSVLMGRAGMVSNWSAPGAPTGGTHARGRQLDYVWLTRSHATFSTQRILGRYGSDHNAIAVLVTNTPKTGPSPSTGTAAPASSTSPAGTSATAGPARPLPASVRVQVDGASVKLDAEQVTIAAAIIAEGKALNIPARGQIVALAATGAESGLRNPDHGDRDSVGPWQMRPSQGWGTVAQIRDVTLGARAFYGMADHTNNPGLVDVKGWEQMSIAAAAQAVERSAFAGAYTRWEAAARTLVDQLGGVDASTAGDSGCTPAGAAGGMEGDCPVTQLPAESVLTSDGLLVLRCVKQQFPAIAAIGTYAGHQPDQTRAVDIMIPGWESSAGKAVGTTIAAWVKTHARELGVQYIIWDGQIWNIQRDHDGWRRYFDADNPDPNRSHRNHVHVSVYGTQGTGPAASTGPATAGAWNLPIGKASRVGCGFTCYARHNGQDYPAPPGTPVYAVNGGTVVRSESILGGNATCATLPICGTTRVSYGNLIVIKLAGGEEVTAWYAHLSARAVSAGQTVRAGQVIGAVGYEGHVEPPGPGGSHLHFEIRTGGTPVDPLPYLRNKGA